MFRNCTCTHFEWTFEQSADEPLGIMKQTQNNPCSFLVANKEPTRKLQGVLVVFLSFTKNLQYKEITRSHCSFLVIYKETTIKLQGFIVVSLLFSCGFLLVLSDNVQLYNSLYGLATTTLQLEENYKKTKNTKKTTRNLQGIIVVAL